MNTYQEIVKQKILEVEADLQAHKNGLVGWSSEELKTMTTLLAQMKRDLEDLNWAPESLVKLTKQ